MEERSDDPNRHPPGLVVTVIAGFHGRFAFKQGFVTELNFVLGNVRWPLSLVALVHSGFTFPVARTSVGAIQSHGDVAGMLLALDGNRLPTFQ